MKNFFKNILITFLTIFFILSFANLIFQVIQYYFIITPKILELATSVSNEGIRPEDSYQMLAEVYAAGYGNKIQIQIMILLLSILSSATISLIFTFEEKSKFKIICYYILGMIVTSLVPTIFNIFYFLKFSLKNFFNELFYYLEDIWIWYIFGFIVLYIIKIGIANKKTGELNKILKKNKMQTNII